MFTTMAFRTILPLRKLRINVNKELHHEKENDERKFIALMNL